MFDYQKLKGKIVEVFDTQAAFAEAMEMNITSLNQRLNGKVEWRPVEIMKACSLLGVEVTDAWEYFFVEKV